MKVTIIGAGFSGLITAYYLKKRGMDVEIVEKSKRIGGLISTLETEYGFIETAANGLINSELVEQLFQDLGLVMTPVRKKAKRRFIFRGRPRQWPLTIVETLGFIFSLLLILLLGLKKKLRPHESETIAQWAERNFGKAFLNYFLAPGLQGIYAGDANRLSASLIIGPLLDRKRSPKKLVIRGTVSPRKGMEQLITGLKSWLEENHVAIRTETEVVWDSRVKDWKWVIATNPSDAAKILAQHPVAKILKNIEVSPIVSVTAFFHPLDAKTSGFGVLFPRGQDVRALGVLFNNEIFEGRSDYRSETWIYGGALDHEVVDLSEPEIISQLLKDRKIVERGVSKPLYYRIQKWPIAIPHYTVQLEKYLKQMPKIENTYLMGNYLGGLGLGKIIQRAYDLSEVIATQDRNTVAVRKLENVAEERSAIH